MKETWIDIKGYENIYEVSNHGRIRTKYGKTTHSGRHGVRVWKQRVLKYRGYTPKTGYRISLWKDKKQKDFLVSRLVAFNFFNEDINNRKLTVNHIDGNRMNNNINNLELISLKENIQHAFNTGLVPQRKIILKRLSDNKILEFRSLSKASIELGFRVGYISYIINKNKKIHDYEILSVGDYKKEKVMSY